MKTGIGSLKLGVGGLWFAIFYLLSSTFSAFGTADVVFPIGNLTSTHAVGRKVIITAIDVDVSAFGLVSGDKQPAVTDANGLVTILGMADGDYSLEITAPPASKMFYFTVTNSSTQLNVTNLLTPDPNGHGGAPNTVKQLIAGANITLDPANGQGLVTISSTGGGGGGGSATNAYQLQVGNALLSLSTNLTTFIYTISGVPQTNANMQQWGLTTPSSYSNGFRGTLGSAAFIATNAFPFRAEAVGLIQAGTNIGGVTADALNNGLISFKIDGIASNQFYSMVWDQLAIGGHPSLDEEDLKQLADFGDSRTNLGANIADNLTAGTLPDARLSSRVLLEFDGKPWTNSSSSGITSTNLGDGASTNFAMVGKGGNIFRGGLGSNLSWDPVAGVINATGGAGGGTFSGPGSSIADNFVSFNGTSGALGKDSGKNASSFDIAGAAGGVQTIVNTHSNEWINGSNHFNTVLTGKAPLSSPSFTGPVQTDGELLYEGGAYGDVNGDGGWNVARFSVAGNLVIDGAGIYQNTIAANQIGSGTIALVRLDPSVATNNLPRVFTNVGWQIDEWGWMTNNTDHSFNLTNTLFHTTPLTILTNGTVLFGGVPLILGTALKASQFVSTDVNTNLISTQDGSGWTNLDTHFTNYGATTNIVLPADGNNWRVLATNGPHNFFSFGGNNMGAISIWITTNGDAALPPQVTYLGYSDIHTTNCIIDLQPWGGTNRVLAGKSEL